MVANGFLIKTEIINSHMVMEVIQKLLSELNVLDSDYRSSEAYVYTY